MASKVSSKPSIPVAEKQLDKTFKPSRPNYKKIHALPLPIKTYPLPPLIPHNPLSILQIAFTYLLQVVAPPSSHPRNLYQGYLSPEARSIHVLDEVTTRILWEQGFFGKGSLSRSEPSWLDRERRRKGIGVIETSEEVTRRRRAERKEFKKERARKEREVIDEKLEEEGRSLAAKLNKDLNNAESSHQTSNLSIENRAKNNNNAPETTSPNPMMSNRTKKSLNSSTRKTSLVDDRTEFPTNSDIVNQEHLQLTTEEAFFLVYGLGILEIREHNASEIIPTASLFSIFRQQSYFPPRPALDLQPDDPFLLSYAVYHHFRSLGWVVRPGIKFAVDYLLYNRGPVFSHAEFAVIILPAYNDPYWQSTPTLAEKTKKESKSWSWLHCVNRVQSQVRKSLLLVYVNIPPPESSSVALNPSLPSNHDRKPPLDGLIAPQANPTIDITSLLKQYKIRELTIRRWTPNRSRD